MLWGAKPIYKSFAYAEVAGENPEMNDAMVMEKFDHYFVPKKNVSSMKR